MGWVLYVVGWTAGWLLLWSTRPLPPGRSDRSPLAVIIPARDEADALPQLLEPLARQLRVGDELVVVDDHSTDATADVAASFGATVVTAPDLPPGWGGKSHACWVGAGITTAPVLVFVDADVRPGSQLLDGVVAAVAADGDAIVSVQPWLDAKRPIERVGVLANVVALMGSGGFTALGRRVRTDVAFGPVLAAARPVYERTGGHAHAEVRASLTEDVALARLVGHSEVFTSPVDATMTARHVLAGWSRTMASGVAATRWWVAVVVAAWVSSLAGGPFAGWQAYPLSAIQMWVLGRRAGRCGPVVAALYPLAVVGLVTIMVGAGGNRVRGQTTWKGRRVPT